MKLFAGVELMAIILFCYLLTGGLKSKKKYLVAVGIQNVVHFARAFDGSLYRELVTYTFPGVGAGEIY